MTDAASGKPVTAVCPGATYGVKLSFPQPRLAMLTASAGAFAKPGDAECPARAFFDRSSGFAAAAAQAMELTLPCGRERLIRASCCVAFFRARVCLELGLSRAGSVFCAG